MKVQAYDRVEQKTVEMEGAKGCAVRWLLGTNVDAPNFAMRQFEVSVGGHTPKHHHPYEHEVFILDGQGVLVDEAQEHVIGKGDVIYVAPDEIHQFRNTGASALKFLCLIPNSAADQQVTVVPECGWEPPA